MELISDLRELKINLLTLERYMSSNNQVERDFHRNLIKLGINFVVYKKNNIHFFAPSRFIGYKNNSMSNHINNKYKDGKETTPKINDILRFHCNYNSKLEIEYRNFCNILGFDAKEKGTYGKRRKYWEISI